MKTKQLLLTLAGVSALAAILTAAEHVREHAIVQKDRAFSVEEITIKPGESLVFQNNDEVTHNVFSKSKANAFVIKTQKPGESSVVAFAEEGTTEVRCAIHPGMKLIVNVKK